MDWTTLTISDAAVALRHGDVSAADYAEALLAQAAAQAALNAFIHHDPAQVRAAARAADALRARGAPLGALHGVPLALKDNLDVAGTVTTAGTPALRAHRPAQHAPVVQRLLDAGAIVFGKAGLHELAYGITNHNAGFGAVRNPYDRTRIPGGSSGGTGAAVAARIVPGGIGTDTGGSVRIPAALCGIVGFRPSTGRWPQRGIVPISHTRDTAGPMARSVADCALLDRVVTGSAEAPAVALQGLRLGVPRAHFWEQIDAETATLMEAVLRTLQQHGAVLVPADVPDVARLDAEAGFAIALHETPRDLDAYLAAHDSPLRFADVVAQVASPDVSATLQGLLGDGAIPAAVYRHARDVLRPQLLAAYAECFRRQDVAALVLPTTPLPAAPIGDDDFVRLNGEPVPTFATFIRNCSPASVAGLPGISLPAACTRAGLPLGLELDAPRDADANLLAIARAAEAVLPPMSAPPR
ncbi:MAG: indoleacetamide hydrolase [Ideonella sp.]|nr:indoleacetamide hydrolase [Ideonella sp.]MCC7455421.1 indoleacetamide hydrolase [Nitrospira sp.]